MSQQFVIRRANTSDAEGIIGAHISSIREVCSKDYTTEQIEAWSRARDVKPELLRQTIERDLVWVVEKDQKIYGFSQLAIMDHDQAEIMGFYLVKEVLGIGLGNQLMNQIIQVCRAEKLKVINLHSTINARNFYQRHGFIHDSSSTTVGMRGVSIPCYSMKLSII